MELPSYFDRDLVRLDELAGYLRQHVPEDLRQVDGAWVVMRRHLPKSVTKSIDRDYRDALRQHPPVENQLTEDYYEATQEIAYRDVIARVVEWGYVEPVETDSLDLLPGNHTDAMIELVRQFKNPVNDEVALQQARAADKSVSDQSERRINARLGGNGTGRVADLEATAPLVAGGPSLA